MGKALLRYYTKLFGCETVSIITVGLFRFISIRSMPSIDSHYFYRLVNDFNDLSEYSLFAFLSYYMMCVASLLMTLQFQLVEYTRVCCAIFSVRIQIFSDLFLLKKWDENSKLFENMILSNLILIVFTVILIVCEPGERVTKQFEHFGVKLDRCKWNKLPIEMQRFYLIFLSDVQQPKHIRSYGGIMCTRETFKQASIPMLSIT